MTPEILVAILSFAGTLIGTVAGIIMANRLIAYRLARLEKQVEKHNNVVERMALVENDMKNVCGRTSRLEQAVFEI